jgi:WD40 repeat protein
MVSFICAVGAMVAPTLGARQAQDAPVGQPRTVLGLAFSPDGKSLAVGTGLPTEPGDVTLWDVATHKPIWKHDEKQGVSTVTFASDGRSLAVALYEQAAKVLDAATGKEVATLRHPAEVRGVAFSPDGKLVATACWDGAVRIWDLANSTERARFAGPRERMRLVQFSPDGKLLAASGSKDGAKVWDVGSGLEKRTFKYGSVAYVAHITPDGKWLLTSSNFGGVLLWDIDTGEARANFSGLGAVHAFDYSLQAGLFAAGSSFASHVSLHELTLREPTPAEAERIKVLLARWEDDSYDVREAASKEVLKLGFVAESALGQAADQSPSAEVRIRARVARERILSEPRALLYGHTDQIECVAFSPDGKLLASGGRDGTVRLWDVAGAKEIARLAPHN